MIESMGPQLGISPPNNYGHDYSFILNPSQPQKGSGFGFIKDPFIAKIVFLVGGTLLFMLIAWIVVTLVFGGKGNVETFISLAQREEEIVRVSAMSRDAVSQQVKNAAINTQVSVKSFQNKTIAYLAGRDRELKPEELTLKKDATVDGRLKQAKETSTFDTVFTTIVRGQLAVYAEELKRAFDNESDGSLRLELAKKYEGVQLLLKQWPESSS